MPMCTNTMQGRKENQKHIKLAMFTICVIKCYGLSLLPWKYAQKYWHESYLWCCQSVSYRTQDSRWVALLFSSSLSYLLQRTCIQYGYSPWIGAGYTVVGTTASTFERITAIYYTFASDGKMPQSIVFLLDAGIWHWSDATK